MARDKPLPVFPGSMSSSSKRRKPARGPSRSDRSENKKSMFTQPATTRSFPPAPSRIHESEAGPSFVPSHRKLQSLSSGLRPSRLENYSKADFHPAEPGEYIPDNRDASNASQPVEYAHMKKEVATLKEEVQDLKKLSRTYIKKYDETKSELAAVLSMLQDKEVELAVMQERSTTNIELLSSIETSIQCQICMELPQNPFSLSPCGHILCLSCLREWFRKAPPTLDSMDMDPEELSDPHFVLMRTKSCPSCRAVVRYRPAPVFMIKAVVSALKKSKPPLPGHLELPVEEDATDYDKNNPWKGIFPSSDEESMDDASEGSAEDFALNTYYSEDDEDLQEELFRMYNRHGAEVPPTMYADSTSDSDNANGSARDYDDEAQSALDDDERNGNHVFLGDSEEEELDYVLPRWTPPTVEIDARSYDISEMNPVHIKLLQRGCTWEMLQNYDISYSHRLGIIVSLHSLDQLYASDDDNDGDSQVDGMNRVFLGWNITLERHDLDGESYMSKVLEDMKENPARWILRPRRGVRGAVDARQLVPADEVIEYQSTDTEVWLDAEPEDL
ncbi:hypothetical protein CVT26_004649 [Gymnopilus dilepis]|uniref:RING-type domain-containing protein n=1 Tax=Gymnopilus dilepis TaxID=231916 RepID=A0A409YTV5_9AGAR|nr:hypothetical protein CVT26_004649 [Gymnopilus dilepis]